MVVQGELRYGDIFGFGRLAVDKGDSSLVPERLNGIKGHRERRWTMSTDGIRSSSKSIDHHLQRCVKTMKKS